MKYLIIIAMLLCLNVNGEDKYAKKGEAWKTWETFIQHVKDQDEEKVKELLSEEMQGMMLNRGIEDMARGLDRIHFEFVREFAGKDKNKDKMYLVMKVEDRPGTVVFTQKDNKWLITTMDQKEIKGPEDIDKIDMDAIKTARTRAKLAVVKSNLKNIGTAIATYFADGTFINYPEKFEDLEIPEEILTYEHPETGKQHKFLFLKLKGFSFQGSSQYITAITDVKIMGKYWAVFEDAHVDSLSDEDFEKHKVFLGLKKADKKGSYTDEEKKEMLALIKQLGAQKFKERKAAEKALKDMGEKIVPFLKENLKQDDFEITASLKDIIKQFKPKKLDGERPEVGESSY